MNATNNAISTKNVSGKTTLTMSSNNKFQIFSNPAFCDIRTMIVENELWFVAADICRALGLQNTTMAMQKVDDEDRAKFNLGLTCGDFNCVNEPGVYALVLTSKKPEAKAFKHWITHDVIPAIRKTGYYSVSTDQNVPKSSNVSASPDVPLSREEMAMYVAAIQEQSNAHTEEVKNMCTGAFTAVCKVIQKQAEENSKVLSIIADTASKQYSSFNLSSAKIAECLTKMSISIEDSAKSFIDNIVAATKSSSTIINNEESQAINDDQKQEELFLATAKDLVIKICHRFSIDLKTAYTLIYGKMEDLDGINVYKIKNDSSVIKSISKNEEARESYIRCAKILSGEISISRNTDNEIKKDVSNVDMSNNIHEKDDLRFLWRTPKEVKDLILEYQKKTHRTTYQYASQVVLKKLLNKINKSHLTFSNMARQYAISQGYRDCCVTYYIANKPELLALVKQIVEEA